MTDFPDPGLLKTNPSKYWKLLVDQFLATLTQKEQDNFELASNKFSEAEPHLYIKDVPWFKEWFKEEKEKINESEEDS